MNLYVDVIFKVILYIPLMQDLVIKIDTIDYRQWYNYIKKLREMNNRGIKSYLESENIELDNDILKFKLFD